MILQWVYRNDSGADVPAQDVIAFDRAVTLEDRAILESLGVHSPRRHEGHKGWCACALLAPF